MPFIHTYISFKYYRFTLLCKHFNLVVAKVNKSYQEILVKDLLHLL